MKISKNGMSRAALLDKGGQVIGEVVCAPPGNYIEVAGAFTASGDPVNVRSHKISRSKRNLARARFESPVVRRGSVYTFG